ncbi:MAG: putative ThiO:disulfide interchange protein [Betaproteobacteria bacterium]|nr:putative ThiO:disulfide interchange protein [Betaproteobacteria bacterium]
MFHLSAFLRRALPAAATFFALVACADAFAAAVKTDYIEAELIARNTALNVGEKPLIGIRLKHAPHWHTYWQNPGDSGMPTTIQWKLPAGFKAGPILWPVPELLPVPPLMNYGYEGEVLLPMELVAIPNEWPAGQPAKLAARVDWLVCKDVCIPGGADLELTLPVVGTPTTADPKNAALFERALAALPGGPITNATAKTHDGVIELRFPGRKPTGHVYVYSGIEGLVEHAAPQKVSQDGNDLLVSFPVTQQLSAAEPRIAGVVTGLDAQALSFAAPMSGKLVAGPGLPPTVAAAAAAGSASVGTSSKADELSFGVALLLALCGGMILNLMPCVFPILSLKVLGFAQGDANNRRAMRIGGIAFAAGVVLSFVALAAALLALRAAGDAVGWGFQLQSPAVVSLLALLFFALGLNLSGVFEFGSFLPGGLAGAQAKNPVVDSALSGVLAAVVASPCTAPFMGAALGFAVTQSAVMALTIFAALGFGMALPYLLLAWFPTWLKRLPRPGPWLLRFKQVLAFPMYATVVWLAWVLVLQVGDGVIPWFGAGLVLVGLGAWILGQARGVTGRVFAVLVLVAGIFSAWPRDDATQAATPVSSQSGPWGAFSKAALAQASAAGKPVFIDFTAAWCVTCQVNKKVVLETTAVHEAFAAKNVVLMRADWTRRDPEITSALAEFGRNGVPVYALYAPGKPVVLLPEILRTQIVLDALKAL